MLRLLLSPIQLELSLFKVQTHKQSDTMSDTVLSVKAQSDRGMDDHIEVVYNGHTHTTTTSVANGHTHTTPRRRPHRHTAQTVPYTPTSPPQHTPTPLSLALGKDVAVIVSTFA